jgi:hypothetical protein
MENFLDLKSKSLSTGLLFLIFGAILLFHTLGLVSVVTNIIMIVLSSGLILIGLSKSGLYGMLKEAWSKKAKGERNDMHRRPE